MTEVVLADSQPSPDAISVLMRSFQRLGFLRGMKSYLRSGAKTPRNGPGVCRKPRTIYCRWRRNSVSWHFQNYMTEECRAS